MPVTVAPLADGSPLAVTSAKWYEGMVAALTSQDLSGVERCLSKTFASISPTGERKSREDYLKQFSEDFASQIYHDVHFTIEKAYSEGPHTVVYLTKRFVVTQRTPKATHFQSTVYSREVLSDSGGLKLHESDTIKRDLIVNGTVPSMEQIRVGGGMLQGCGDP